MILGHKKAYAVHIVPYARIIVHVEAMDEGEAARNAEWKLNRLAKGRSEMDFGRGKYVAGSINVIEPFREPVEVYELDGKYGPYTGNSWWVKWRSLFQSFMTDKEYVERRSEIKVPFSLELDE